MVAAMSGSATIAPAAAARSSRHTLTCSSGDRQGIHLAVSKYGVQYIFGQNSGIKNSLFIALLNRETMAPWETHHLLVPFLHCLRKVSKFSHRVVNAQHMKAVHGRKTDVKDAEWTCDLLRHGLLKASFIPDPDQNQSELRELVRNRLS